MAVKVIERVDIIFTTIIYRVKSKQGIFWKSLNLFIWGQNHIMSQSTVVSLLWLAVTAAHVGYIVGQDDRERAQSSQQIEQTSPQKEGDAQQKWLSFFRIIINLEVVMVILTAIGFLLILIMLLTIIIRPQLRNDWRISQIERKLDLILQQLDIDSIDTSLEAVRSQLARNKKVEAVKIFREINPGISLKDAVSSVDTIDREMRQQSVR
jgi:hypothetical protein